MIATIDVQVSASNPTIPLFPWRTFRNSLSSVRVRNVPRKIGKWNITTVSVSAKYPDNKIVTSDCVLVGGVWIATMPSCDVAGWVANGYSVVAKGTDENGNELVDGYILGRGDIEVVDCDYKTTTVPVSYAVTLLPNKPENPNDGDIWLEDGVWKIQCNGKTTTLGISKSDVKTMIGNIKPSDIGALGDKGEVTIRPDGETPATLILKGNSNAGGGKLIVESDPSDSNPASVEISQPDMWYGGKLTIYGGELRDGARITLVDNHRAYEDEMWSYLKSEIIIGDVKVRGSIESLKSTLAPVSTTLSAYVKDVVETAYPNADAKEY